MSQPRGRANLIPTLVLASHSPRRRQLLRQVGFRFRVIPSGIEEPIDPRKSPSANVRRIAFDKAADVARRIRRGIVIGADTEVVLKGRVFGKPGSRSEARRMLRKLSGRTHTVLTGVAIVDAHSGRRRTFVERTRVTFRVLTDMEIKLYVASGSPMDKAGAYGIQDDHGAVFVEKMSGCFYTVVGFPLARFHVELQKFLQG